MIGIRGFEVLGFHLQTQPCCFHKSPILSFFLCMNQVPVVMGPLFLIPTGKVPHSSLSPSVTFSKSFYSSACIFPRFNPRVIVEWVRSFFINFYPFRENPGEVTKADEIAREPDLLARRNLFFDSWPEIKAQHRSIRSEQKATAEKPSSENYSTEMAFNTETWNF